VASSSSGDVNIKKDDIFQLIQAHQEKAARLPAIEEIRTVLDRSLRGTLSTFSKVTDCF
ncbi:root border cell-specific protein, partial [Trifolium pratense]